MVELLPSWQIIQDLRGASRDGAPTSGSWRELGEQGGYRRGLRSRVGGRPLLFAQTGDLEVPAARASHVALTPG